MTPAPPSQEFYGLSYYMGSRELDSLRSTMCLFDVVMVGAALDESLPRKLIECGVIHQNECIRKHYCDCSKRSLTSHRRTRRF